MLSETVCKNAPKKELLDTPDDLCTVSLVMDEVVCTKAPLFKQVLKFLGSISRSRSPLNSSVVGRASKARERSRL